MRWRTVEVEVVLLHILAVIAFAVGQSEEPLLENRILAVPQGQGKAEVLLVIGNAGDAILAPAISTRTGMIVGEKVPGVAVLAVVLAHGAPLAFAQIGPPLSPRSLLLSSLAKSNVFCGHGAPAMCFTREVVAIPALVQTACRSSG